MRKLAMHTWEAFGGGSSCCEDRSITMREGTFIVIAVPERGWSPHRFSRAIIIS